MSVSTRARSARQSAHRSVSGTKRFGSNGRWQSTQCRRMTSGGGGRPRRHFTRAGSTRSLGRGHCCFHGPRTTSPTVARPPLGRAGNEGVAERNSGLDIGVEGTLFARVSTRPFIQPIELRMTHGPVGVHTEPYPRVAGMDHSAAQNDMDQTPTHTTNPAVRTSTANTRASTTATLRTVLTGDASQRDGGPSTPTAASHRQRSR